VVVGVVVWVEVGVVVCFGVGVGVLGECLG